MIRGAAVAVASAAWVLVAAAPASAAYRVGPLRTVSAALGAAGQACPAPGQPRTSDHSVASDPKDPLHLVAAWMQDRGGSDAGGAQGLGVAVSRDGGESWSAARLRGLTGCDGGPGQNSAVNEAQVTIGYDGTAYLTGEVYRGSSRLAFVARSPDGGTHWAPPAVLDPTERFAGRESVSADPVHPSRAYVSWNRVEPNPVGPLLATSVLLAAGTDDSGASWSPARLVREPGAGRYDVGSHVLRGRDGSLVDVFSELAFANLAGPPLPGASHIPIRSVRSVDGAASWSDPIEVGSIEGGAITDPETGSAVNLFPGVSTARAPDGTIYVAWRTGADGGPSRIDLARSSDGGTSWTTLPPAATLPTPSFLPQVAVARNGVVGVSWYDLRDDRPGDEALSTRVWFASSADRGTTWQEAPLTGPFDVRSTFSGDESLIGDTAGLAGTKDGFVATFNAGPPLARRGPTELFSARVQRCSVRVSAPVCDPPLGLGAVRLRPRRIRRGRAGRLSLRLSRPAGVSVLIERRLAGGRRGRRCVAPRRGRPRCTRFQRKRVLSFDGHAGRNSARVTARRLPRGRYRARVFAVDVIGGVSPERRVSFRIR